MSYFRVHASLSLGEETSIEGEVARHMRDARRVKVGEEIEVQDDAPKRFVAKVTAANRNSITILPVREVSFPKEPKYRITLIQALISEQNIDLILQKATELGAASIVFFQATNSPHTLHKDRLIHKMGRWQRILEAACEQSGRPIPPLIQVVDSLESALAHSQGNVYLLEETGSAEPRAGNTTLIVGPEGGLTDAEKSFATSQGAIPFSLGPYTLRAETAAISSIARVV